MGKGQLLFKGEKPKKKKKKSKHHSSSSKHENEVSTSSSPIQQPLAEPPPDVARKPTTTLNSVASAAPAPPSVHKGTGKITTSGTVVTGYDTCFEKELNVGDALLCIVNGQEELRVITMRLSNQSLNLSSAFSSSLKTPTSFSYIPKPRNAAKERKEALKLEKQMVQQQQTHAFDLYKSTDTLIYREKTETGSYRIKQEPVSSSSSSSQRTKSRGDLLEMRAKKTSDKYC